MTEKTILIDLHYLPSMEYLTLVHSFDHIIFEAYENFQKQTYRNRCYIRGANKIQALTVPVKKEKDKVLVKDVRISYNQRWWKEHARSLASAYGKAPYFQFYADIFEKTYAKKHIFLIDLNLELLTICLELLSYNKTLSISETFSRLSIEGVFDARGLIRPGKSHENNSFYNPVPYGQVFGKVFDENLSVIDLLYNEGRNGKQIIAISAITS